MGKMLTSNIALALCMEANILQFYCPISVYQMTVIFKGAITFKRYVEA